MMRVRDLPSKPVLAVGEQTTLSEVAGQHARRGPCPSYAAGSRGGMSVLTLRPSFSSLE
jgi:hypothetical protein